MCFCFLKEGLFGSSSSSYSVVTDSGDSMCIEFDVGCCGVMMSLIRARRLWSVAMAECLLFDY